LLVCPLEVTLTYPFWTWTLNGTESFRDIEVSLYVAFENVMPEGRFIVGEFPKPVPVMVTGRFTTPRLIVEGDIAVIAGATFAGLLPRRCSIHFLLVL
jgi:hypothetical protein